MSIFKLFLSKKKPSPKKIFSFFVSIFFLFATLQFTSSSLSFPSENSPIEFYSNDTGDDLKTLFERAIKNAKSKIILFTFTLSDTSLIYLLNQKCKEGIEIEILTDYRNLNSLSKTLNRNIALHSIREAGLMHEKVLIIDDSLIFLGSANCSYASLKFNSNLVIGFYSKELIAYFLEEKQRILNKKIGEEPLKPLSIQDKKISLSFFPQIKRGQDPLLNLLRTAKKTAKAAIYTFTHHEVADEFLLAKKRGVQVTVHLDYSSLKGSSADIYKKIRNKIPVFTNQEKALLHHKMVYIDSHTLLFGSANWTKAAFTRNRDYYMVIENLSLKEQLKLDSLFENLQQKHLKK